jgi:diadenosine tetraphosphate (Ap4A) HIT family hydrolase
MAFELDPRLAASSLELGRHGNCRVLLKNNAHFLWLLLVPEVNVSEIHELPEDVYVEVCSRTRSLSAWIKEAFPVDKVNVAAIGNVVSQLHVHIVGRTRDDVAWPGTVWACDEKKPFTEAEIDHILACYRHAFGTA